MRIYCTLFDSRFLPQGLALYESLKRHSSEPFILHVLPLDEHATATLVLLKMSDPGRFANLIIKAWEYFAALGADRTWQEYCWTCASQMAERILQDEEEITYLDADLFFFSDPAVVFEEIGAKSIAITPHRLIPSKRHLIVNGEYNVGWVTFKNSTLGRHCLEQWAADVRNKCSAIDGCGDQKYLDAWPGMYPGACHIIQNIGVNTAPWNVGQWEVTEGPCVGVPNSQSRFPIVCYHFHEYIHGERLTNYELRQEDRDLIYAPYIAEVEKQKERVAPIAMQLQAERA